jgi:5-methylcytosine-specific restriction endonuclease McrA
VPESICVIPLCGKRVTARGWCSMHYTRWVRFGDPLARTRGEIRDGKRICPKCKRDRLVSDYSPSQSWCRQCFAARKRAQPLPPPTSKRPLFCVECATCFVPLNRRDICCSDSCTKSRVRRFMREDTLNRRAIEYSAFVESVDPQTVYQTGQWICGLCREAIDPTLTWPAPGSPSVDHIVPLNAGGDHSYANCQPAHLGCNASKGDRVA